LDDRHYENALRAFLNALRETPDKEAAHEIADVPVGVSNRHAHLSVKDREILFGADHALTSVKALSQPGQFASKETLTVCGPKGVLERVRVLGPERAQTQVELLHRDCFTLGIAACLRMSGDLRDSPGVTLVGPKGSVQLREGAIVARRHIHMRPEDAERFGVGDGAVVSIRLSGARGGVYDQVVIRVSEASTLDCHIDVEEANGMGVGPASIAQIVKHTVL
jgi:propanediol utilization protein